VDAKNTNPTDDNPMIFYFLPAIHQQRTMMMNLCGCVSTWMDGWMIAGIKKHETYPVCIESVVFSV
jgi:hypothetical protein